VEVVDPTGGGDAFVTTFTVLHARGEPLARAGRLAAAAAAHTVAALGGRPRFSGEGELAALAGLTPRS
jgi:ribokinase